MFRHVKLFFTAILTACVLVSSVPNVSYAFCCRCAKQATKKERKEWEKTYDILEQVIETEFTTLKIWWAQLVWEDNVLPALMMMADELTAVAMQQMMIIGGFMDAKIQMDTQQLLQEMDAEVHKRYHPSIEMCKFGTQVKSLAASERKTEIGAFFMSQRNQDRNMRNVKSAAAGGEGLDKMGRLDHFRNTFCDTQDNNGALAQLCGGASDVNLINADVDFTRVLEFPWTLDVDFTDNEKTNDEEALMGLQNNLFAYEVPKFPTGEMLKPQPGSSITDAQRVFQDARSIAAKRSVAQNSFGAITAMKSEGTPEAREYLISVVRELGLSRDEAEAFTARALFEGEEWTDWKKLNPSYYAQMEVLTKKLYQDPDFYTHLYDTPANVDRRGVALQAINLMQKFDFLKSLLRSEAAYSVMLELAVMDVQDDVETEIGRQKSGGPPLSD